MIEATIKRGTMLTKPLQIVATRQVTLDLAQDIVVLAFQLKTIFEKDTFDMYVLESSNKGTIIRAAGYKNFSDELDEETILRTINFVAHKKIWFKVDDYGDFYLGTFLYPEEY